MSRAYKKLSSHGSINIPAAMRREAGIEPKDPMTVELIGNEIKITPYQLRCNFCTTTENVLSFYGKGICKNCGEKILERLNGNEYTGND